MIIRITLLFVLFLAGCSSEQAETKQLNTAPKAVSAGHFSTGKQAPFTSISALEARMLIATREDLLILDTRTSREIYSHGIIAGSRQTSMRAIFQDDLPIAKNTPILVVCAVGGRSYAAGQIMVRHGFQEIYNLSGGLDQWKKAGLPVTYPPNSQALAPN